MSSGAPTVTHLFFADDNLVFCQATNAANECLQRLLQLYEFASGQKIDLDKIELLMSINVADQVVNNIKELWNVNSLQHHDRYLGLSSFIGKSRTSTFKELKEWVWRKLQGWKEKLFSQAVREILIKAVVWVLPTYTMNYFKLPNSFCKELEAMFARFQ